MLLHTFTKPADFGQYKVKKTKTRTAEGKLKTFAQYCIYLFIYCISFKCWNIQSSAPFYAFSPFYAVIISEASNILNFSFAAYISVKLSSCTYRLRKNTEQRYIWGWLLFCTSKFSSVSFYVQVLCGQKVHHLATVLPAAKYTNSTVGLSGDKTAARKWLCATTLHNNETLKAIQPLRYNTF